MLRRLVILMLIIIFTPVPASAKGLSVGLGNFKPYFIREQNSGLFTEIIKETFSLMPQYKIIFKWDRPLKRLAYELDNGKLDAAALIISKSDNTYLSEPIFRFTDVAVTLKSRKLVISSISDLKDKSVVTYYGAKIFLGEEFAIMAQTHPKYVELPVPMSQAKMVAEGRYEVSVGDIYVFLQSIKEWKDGKFKPEQFDFHRLFPDKYTYMGFREKKVCDEFNQALKRIKENGKYEALYQKYLQELGYED